MDPQKKKKNSSKKFDFIMFGTSQAVYSGFSTYELLNCGFFWLADSCKNNYCFVKYNKEYSVSITTVKLEKGENEQERWSIQNHSREYLALIIA